MLLLLISDTELCQLHFQKTFAKSMALDQHQSEKMIKSSSFEELTKAIKEKLFKFSERNGLFISINSQKIKLMVLPINYQSIHLMLQLLNLDKEKIEWQESLKY